MVTGKTGITEGKCKREQEQSEPKVFPGICRNKKELHNKKPYNSFIEGFWKI